MEKWQDRKRTGSMYFALCFALFCIKSELFQNVFNSFPSFRENMPSHFKVKEYCPLVFRNLRERFTIDDQDYKESMTR